MVIPCLKFVTEPTDCGADSWLDFDGVEKWNQQISNVIVLKSDNHLAQLCELIRRRGSFRGCIQVGGIGSLALLRHQVHQYAGECPTWHIGRIGVILCQAGHKWMIQEILSPSSP